MKKLGIILGLLALAVPGIALAADAGAADAQRPLDPLQIALALIAIIASLVGAMVILVKSFVKQSKEHSDAMVGVLTTSMAGFREDLRDGLQSVDDKLERMGDSLTSMRDDFSVVRANTDLLVYGDRTPVQSPPMQRPPGQAIPGSGRTRRGG